MAEVGHAVARQVGGLRKANEWVLQLLPLYEHVFEQPNGHPGLPFDQVYDLTTVQPTSEWMDMYHQTKAALHEMGLKLSSMV